MVGEVEGEEEEEEEGASGRREGNMMGDGEKLFALLVEEYVSPPSSETSEKEAKEAYRSPASNSNSCFTQGGHVHIHVHVTGEDVAGLSGDGLNVVCNGLLG